MKSKIKKNLNAILSDIGINAIFYESIVVTNFDEDFVWGSCLEQTSNLCRIWEFCFPLYEFYEDINLLFSRVIYEIPSGMADSESNIIEKIVNVSVNSRDKCADDFYNIITSDQIDQYTAICSKLEFAIRMKNTGDTISNIEKIGSIDEGIHFKWWKSAKLLANTWQINKRNAENILEENAKIWRCKIGICS